MVGSARILINSWFCTPYSLYFGLIIEKNKCMLTPFIKRFWNGFIRSPVHRNIFVLTLDVVITTH